MLLALLIYAYCQGVRFLAADRSPCVTAIAFRVLCAQDGPDHATIARFRAGNQDAFGGLFTQVLLVAAAAGLTRLGTVANDGTKIAASASLDANRGREWLERQVSQIVAEAGEADAAEDAAGAAGGDRVPGQLADGTGRLRSLQLGEARVTGARARDVLDARARGPAGAVL